MTEHIENPYAPPKDVLVTADRHLEEACAAWIDKRALVVRRGAELPDRCLKCNAPAEGFRFTRTVSWIRPIWLILLISPIVFLIAYLLVRWSAKISVGVCPRHRKMRRRAIVLGWLAALAGIAVFILGSVAPKGAENFVILGGFLLVIGGLVGGSLGSRILSPTKIDKNFVWLANVSPVYLAQFRDWNA
jgi:hypothetical protein